MTLASSGSLTSAQINTELGLSSFNMGSVAARNLAGKPASSYDWDDYRGQTKNGLFTEGGTYTDAATSGGVASFTGVVFGAFAWNRRVFIAVHWACATSAVETTISSATINGSAATVHRQSGEGGSSALSNYGCAIISAVVGANVTSGPVTITFSNATVRSCLITSYRSTGNSGTLPVDSDAQFDEAAPTPTIATTQTTCVMTNASLYGVSMFAATFSSDGVHGAMSSSGISERQESVLSPYGRCISGYTTGLNGGTMNNIVSGTSTTTARLRHVSISFRLL